jgi:sugar lactone lactonase YvrE
VSRTEHNGRIATIADSRQGRRFSSPNDVVVKSDSSIWFTDPTYGIVDDYQGRRAEPEIDTRNVYRVDGHTGGVTVVADDFVRPNGLACSPDERFSLSTAGGRKGRNIRRTLASSQWRATGFAAAKSSPTATSASSMDCAPMKPAICGSAQEMESVATPRTERSPAKC